MMSADLIATVPEFSPTFLSKINNSPSFFNSLQSPKFFSQLYSQQELSQDVVDEFGAMINNAFINPAANSKNTMFFPSNLTERKDSFSSQMSVADSNTTAASLDADLEQDLQELKNMPVPEPLAAQRQYIQLDEPPKEKRRRRRLDKMTREEAEREKLARLERSRQSARDCRKRKKNYINTLEEKIRMYEAREAKNNVVVNKLTSTVSQLQAEMLALQQSVAKQEQQQMQQQQQQMQQQMSFADVVPDISSQLSM